MLVETDQGTWSVSPESARRQAMRLRAVFEGSTGSVPITRLLTMAFAPGVMLGSSHPDRPHRGVPTNLGLLTSRDGGRTWGSKSLFGKADLHLLQPTAKGLWALDVARSCLAITNDFGTTWACKRLPGIITAIAVDPHDSTHGVAVTDHGLLETRNAGSSWRPAAFGDADAVTWAPDGTLYGASRGSVRRARGGAGASETVGELDGPIVALGSGGATLWALTKSGVLSRSSDRGHTWVGWAKLR